LPLPRLAAWAACAAWALLLVLSARALAQTAQTDDAPGTALIVRVPGDERIVTPLRAELSSYRFHVLELADRVATRNTRLPDLANQYSAQAAVRALPEATAVELCVVSPRAALLAAASKSEVVNAGPTRDPAVLAVRITEVMRARGLRLRLAEPTATTARPDDVRESPSVPDSAAAGARAAVQDPPQTAGGPAPPRTMTSPPSAATTPSATSPAARSNAPVAPQPMAAGAGRDPTLEPPVAPPPAEAAAPRTPKPAPRATPSATRRTQVEDEEADDPDETTVEVEQTDEPAAEDSDEEADSAAADEPAQPRHRSLWQAELGGAVVVSPGTNGHGLGPSWDGFAQLSIRPFSILSFSVFGLVPLWQAELERKIGTARIRTYVIGAFGDLHARPGPRLGLSFGLGAASLLTSVVGRSDATAYANHSDSLRTPAVLARAGLAWHATTIVHLTVRGLVGFALPDELKVELAEANGTAASWGRPFLALTLGCEVAPTWP